MHDQVIDPAPPRQSHPAPAASDPPVADCAARALSLAILELLPGLIIRPLSVTIGRYDYRAGFTAKRSVVDLPPIRHFEAIVRETAQGDCD